MTSRLRRAAEAGIGWLGVALLLPCLYYPYAGPNSHGGFVVDERTWRVVIEPDCAPGEPCLEVGDQLLSVNGVTAERYRRDRLLSLTSLFAPRGFAPVEVERHGERLRFDLRLGESVAPPALALLSFASPLIFLAAGLLAAVWLRPRDQAWWVLVLLFYDIALWIASGFGQRAAAAALVFHAAIWWFAPLTLHLHSLLPEPLLGPRARRPVLGLLYAGAGAGAALDLAARIPGRSYLLAFALGILGSVVLLLIQTRRESRAAERPTVRLIAFGMAFSLLPFAITYVAMPALVMAGVVGLESANGWSPYLGGLSLLALPILPASYLYAIGRRSFGALEIRASRVAGSYAFVGLLAAALVPGALLLVRWLPGVSELGVLLGLTALAALVLGAAALRRPLQRFVDRRVFGLRYAPEDIVALVAARVPSAFDRRLLAELLADDVLPALLVRRSALVLLGERPEVLYARGVDAAGEAELADCAARFADLEAPAALAGRATGAGACGRNWALLAVPLRVRERTLGVWLLGRRDPDDRYGAGDARLLATVASQVAPMLENVRLFEAARRSEDRFRALFAATLEGIAIVRDGAIMGVNPALERLLGESEAALVGRPFDAVLPVAVPPDERSIEGRLARPDEERVLEIAARRYELQGEAVAVVSVRDVTRQRADEAARRELQRQLQQAQKMEAVGRLSAGVAHDFNNTLLALFHQIDLLRDTHAGDAALQSELGEMRAVAERAADLTRRLLAFARRQPMQPRPVDPNAIVRGMTAMLERTLGGAVRVTVDLAPELGLVLVDPGPLEQVLLNLAVNARDAMPRGGTLAIRTLRREIRDGAELGRLDLRPGAYAALEVTDTGAGMDAETLARVFEPFFTTKPEGTGLGLATAYGVVRQSGGHIAARSRLGAGTSFTVYLPLLDEAARAAVAAPTGSAKEPRPAAVAAPAPAGGTVLLVEDEPLGRRVLTQILERAGYRVLAAGSGEEALATLAREAAGSAAIDALVTDVQMSGMDGTELAARLEAERPGLRVVFMTGHDDGRLAGRPALLKPFSRPALLAALADGLVATAK